MLTIGPVSCDNMQSNWLRLQVRQSMNKIAGNIAMLPEHQKKTTDEIIAERLSKDSEKHLKLIIQLHKELFNSDS